MARTIHLTGLKQGIQRVREKGGADPDTLYDLEDGYVGIDGAIEQRPGTGLAYDLPAGTLGLAAHDGDLVVFSTSPKACPAGTRCEVITHPFFPSQGLTYIWYAAPFLGYLYVVGEFENGDIYHYWLQAANEWEASTKYDEGQIIVPSTANGLGYKAHRVLPKYPTWVPGMEVTLGDKIEPTVANGYYYEATETSEADGVGTPGGSPNPNPVPVPGDGGTDAPTGWVALSGTWTEDPAGTFNLLPNGASSGLMYRVALYAFSSGTLDASIETYGPVLSGFAGLTIDFLNADGNTFLTEYVTDTGSFTAAALAPFGTVTHARVYLRALSSTPLTSAVVFSNLSIVVTP